MIKGLFFELDYVALIIAAAFCLALVLAWRNQQRFPNPHFLFSSTAGLKEASASWRTTFTKMVRWLEYAALGFFILAFIDPHLERTKPSAANPNPTEGIAIYLLADQSGSMKEKIRATDSNGQIVIIPKIDLLRQITTQFVQGDPAAGLKGRPDDLIGLVAFARTANVLSPLSLDHQGIASALRSLNAVQRKEDDGTAMGYALFKTVNLIAATRHYAEDVIGNARPAYDIKSTIIILVTDGFPDPNPLDKGNSLRNMDLISAAQYAKEKNVRVYLVTIDPALASEEFTPHRHLMQRVAELTGGKYYLISDANGLMKIYKDIDSLEKSALPDISLLPKDQQPNRYQRISLYPYLIVMGMLALLAAIGIKTAAIRQVP